MGDGSPSFFPQIRRNQLEARATDLPLSCVCHLWSDMQAIEIRLFLAPKRLIDVFTSRENDEVAAMRYLMALLTVLVFATTPAKAMDRIVTDTGDVVTVDEGTTFTEGDLVPVYDADGTEHDLQVMSVTDAADSTTVDFVDADSGDPETVQFPK